MGGPTSQPLRGRKLTIAECVDQLLKEGYGILVDADPKGYFDTIPYEPLMALVRERIADGCVLSLIESSLKVGILDGLKEWTPEAGAPQRAVLNPLLSHISLNPLDHVLVQWEIEMVRYADDFVILLRTPEAAEQALALDVQWTAAIGLTLHPTKTKIVDVRVAGFDFLGYRFAKHRRFVRKKSLTKFKDAIREKTKRTNGTSLPMIIRELNSTLRGWFGYFQQAYRTTFPELDSWVRGRLRSILRRCSGRRGRGNDHHRWPKKFFHQHGLYSQSHAHQLACQSCLR